MIGEAWWNGVLILASHFVPLQYSGNTLTVVTYSMLMHTVTVMIARRTHRIDDTIRRTLCTICGIDRAFHAAPVLLLIRRSIYLEITFFLDKLVDCGLLILASHYLISLLYCSMDVVIATVL